MKLRVRLGITIGVLTFCVTSALTIVFSVRATTNQKEAIYAVIENLTGMYAQSFSKEYSVVMNTVQTLADLMATYNTIEADQRRFRFLEILNSTMRAHSDYVRLFSVWEPYVLDGMEEDFRDTPIWGGDQEGNFVPMITVQNGRFTVSAFYDAARYLNAIPTQPTVVEPAFQDIGGQQVVVVRMLYPIVEDGMTDPVGIVGVDINLAPSQAIIETIQPYENSMSFLVSNKGFTVAQSDPARVGKFVQDGLIASYGEAGAGYADQFMQVVKDNKNHIFNAEGGIFSVYPLAIGNTDTPWIFATVVPEAAAMDVVQSMTRFVVIINIILLFVVEIIMLFIVSRIVRPISHLVNRVKDVAEGDLTKSIKVNSKDEIGDLAQYFNKMVENLKGLIMVIKNQSVVLFDVGNELASNTTETAAAINQITSNIHNIKEQITTQSASITETNATMKHITVNISELNDIIEQQTESVAQSSSAIEEMLANIQSVTQTLVQNTRNVEDLSDASEIGRNGLEEVAADIQGIARESEGLLEINAVMESIASQTNLLSMNAAIEAAHAGEAGKGFAVVADEIRKLAESSGEQSKTISTVLKKIKNSIDKITLSTDDVLNRFEDIDTKVRKVSEQEENIRNAMEEQGKGSREVLESVGRLNDLTQKVKEGAIQMFEGSTQVIHESEGLESVTQKISQGMSEMSAGAEQINIAVNKVSDISDNNKENTNILVREVARFKVE
ncbi:MAG: methyl-accepting chemotaxis protein [Treponema sp.]|nr:methyl-accepting chemotaxis protein [Treponema sp.]